MLTRMVYGFLPVPDTDFACTTNVYAPPCVGTPVICPTAFNDRPGGTCPLVTLNVLPTAYESAAKYGVPMYAVCGANVDGENVDAALAPGADTASDALTIAVEIATTSALRIFISSTPRTSSRSYSMPRVATPRLSPCLPCPTHRLPGARILSRSLPMRSPGWTESGARARSRSPRRWS